MPILISGVLEHRCNPDAGYTLAKLQSNIGYAAWEWKYRFCRLDHRGLSYWAEGRLPRKDDQNWEKQFPWHRIVAVQESGDKEKDNRFQFKVRLDEGEKIILAAETPEDMARWVQLLKEGMERAWMTESGSQQRSQKKKGFGFEDNFLPSLDPKQTAKSVKGLVYSTASLFSGTVTSTVSAVQHKIEGAMASVQDQMEILAGRDDSDSAASDSFDSAQSEKEEESNSWRLSEHEKLHREKYLQGDKELLDGLWDEKDTSLPLQEAARARSQVVDNGLERSRSIWRTYSNAGSIGPQGAASSLKQWIATLGEEDEMEMELPKTKSIDTRSHGDSSSGGRDGDSPSVTTLSRKGSEGDPRTKDLQKKRREVVEQTKHRLNIVSNLLASLEERVVSANKLTQELDVMEDSVTNSLREVDTILIQTLESAGVAADKNTAKKQQTAQNLRHISKDLAIKAPLVVSQLHSNIDRLEESLQESQAIVEGARAIRLSCEDLVVERTPPGSYYTKLQELLYNLSLLLLRVVLWVGVSIFILGRNSWALVAWLLPSFIRNRIRDAVGKKKRAEHNKWTTVQPSNQTTPELRAVGPRRENSMRRLESMNNLGMSSDSRIRNKMKEIKSERENRKNLRLRTSSNNSQSLSPTNSAASPNHRPALPGALNTPEVVPLDPKPQSSDFQH